MSCKGDGVGRHKAKTAQLSFDVLLPPAMATNAEDVGVTKISLGPFGKLFADSVSCRFGQGPVSG
jgi:hypothetical protein